MNAIHLYADEGCAVVSIEHEGKWIVLMREPLDSPFSHIIEPAGIERTLRAFKCGNVDESGVWIGT